MIKFWAWIYRLTGWYSPFAELAEYRYIKTKMDKIEERYENWGDISIDDAMGLEIGMWQAKHKFYRRWKNGRFSS